MQLDGSHAGRGWVLVLAVAAAVSLCASDPSADLKAAVRQLASQPNYSWSATTQMEGMPGNLKPTEGKAEKGGITLLTMELGQQKLEAAAKGTLTIVKTDQGWQSTAELDAAGPNRGLNRGRVAARMMSGLRQPVDELGVLIGKLSGLKVAPDGSLEADLTPEGAREWLEAGRPARSGPGAPAILQDAKGNVKFWLQGGVLVKYQVHAEAALPGQAQTTRTYARTTTIELKDVGKTDLGLPDDARKKLSPQPAFPRQ